MDQLNAIGYFLNSAKILVWVLFGLVTLIGSIDKLFPNAFPEGIKALKTVKNSTSDNRFLLLIISFLEFLILAVWKISSALFKLLIATIQLIIVFFKKSLTPLLVSANKKIETATVKIDEVSQRMEDQLMKLEESTNKMEESAKKDDNKGTAFEPTN